MDAIILAGGLGTRLSSVVHDIPKCMAPVAGRPFLYYLLRYLSHYPIGKVILSVGHLREHIFSWIDSCRQQFPFPIVYAVEESPLGTGGAIKLAMQQVEADEAVIINGDTFFDVDLNCLLQQHRNAGTPLSIALKPMTNFDRFGNVIVDEDSRIIKFQEKQYCKEGLINGGIYLINREQSFFVNQPEKFSFEKNVLEEPQNRGVISGFCHDRYFMDMGIPTDYARINEDFKTYPHEH
jgi:D-glycero-alpha-D-manno-heptose 1-phosphate guanylyltransferase